MCSLCRLNSESFKVSQDEGGRDERICLVNEVSCHIRAIVLSIAFWEQFLDVGELVCSHRFLGDQRLAAMTSSRNPKSVPPVAPTVYFVAVPHLVPPNNCLARVSQSQVDTALLRMKNRYLS